MANASRDAKTVEVTWISTTNHPWATGVKSADESDFQKFVPLLHTPCALCTESTWSGFIEKNNFVDIIPARSCII
jgi:hypothetical protein